MSTVSDTGAVTNRYFCYQCNSTVTITPQSPSSELICPNCNGSFLEEFDESSALSPHPILNVPNFFPPVSENNDFLTLLRGGNRFENRVEFDPLSFFMTYLHTLRAGGANIQFVVDNNNNNNNDSSNNNNNNERRGFYNDPDSLLDPFGFRIPFNLGDYVVGPGLEQLIQQLSENDPNRHGPPPAAKSAVEGLKSVEIRDEMSDGDYWQCAVCMEIFEVGVEAKEMPCKHLFHSDCILPWLEMHNSCPVCRFELPTDDEDYENRKRGGDVESSGGGVGQSSGGGLVQLSGGRPLALEAEGKPAMAELEIVGRGMRMLEIPTPIAKLQMMSTKYIVIRSS
ncbi:RING-type E3 ubiquitin transferase [Heracleum sosnowskyi]|uniref:RING-type E3 ubiquitin transferase n=1 Tax=Heracleum sosnowskyi TaxID=360622 RepID=A0AAD8MGE3_9APIA|nr:RING-type E3 ubiquitin transferase [Heracleum sosnowskyi]